MQGRHEAMSCHVIGANAPKSTARHVTSLLLGIFQDPEGILAAPKGGHIQRRSLEKQMAQDKALALEVEREKERAHAELVAERAVSISRHLHLVMLGQ